MPLGRCILKSNESTPVSHTYFPLSAIVKFEGDKKPDTLEATFPMQNDVNENYQISYIQDIVDTTYLRAIYPMHLSCLDESGFDQDPTTDPPDTRFIKVSSGRYKGHYALDFNATSQNVDINTVDKIDISKQFDIHIKFTPDPTQFISGNNEPILWSFYDGSNGLEIGISNQHDSIWRAFVRVAGGSTNAYRGSTETIMNSASVHIRVKRGMDNILRVYVNGIEESLDDVITQSSWNGLISSSLQPTGVPMIFGNGRGTNDHYKGQIHEIRVYSGTDLDDIEAERIRWSKPIPQVMKFAGRISRLISNQTTNKAICQSNSYKFTKGKLGGNVSSLVSHSFSEVTISFTGGTNTLNIGNKITGATSLTEGVVTEFISGDSVAGTIKLINRFPVTTPFTSGETLNESVSTGAWSATYTGGTETSTHLTFKQMLQSAVDVVSPLDQFNVRNVDLFEETTKKINNIYGSIYEIGDFMQYAGILLTYSECIMYITPRKNIIVETNSGHTTDYLFDQNSSSSPYHIKNSENNDITIVNEVILTGRTGVTNAISEFTPAQGIRRTLRMNVLQIDTDDDLEELSIRTRLNLQGVDITKDVAPLKYLIQSSSPVHHVRYNHTVKLSRRNGYNDSITFSPTRGSDDIFEQVEVVKQIELHYPSGRTIIKVGNNDIDLFDNVSTTTQISDGLLDNTL